MSRVLLIGHPVAHSLSPAMHNAAFAALGLPHRYETREEARRIGALNTIARRGSRLVGTNTDAYGFERATHDANGRSIFGSDPVLILGAGGAARACAYALLATNDVLVANR